MSQVLHFRSKAGKSDTETRFRWVGAWPPPAELAVVREKATAVIKVIRPEEQPEGWVQHFKDHADYEVLEFALNGTWTTNVADTHAEYVLRRKS